MAARAAEMTAGGAASTRIRADFGRWGWRGGGAGRGRGGARGGEGGGVGGFDADPGAFRQMRLAGDMVALLAALGVERARAVVGHDFGPTVAAHCALVRPEPIVAAAVL